MESCFKTGYEDKTYFTTETLSYDTNADKADLNTLKIH